MRITTNSMMRNYNTSLTTSMARRTSTMEKVYSQRQFNNAYEDPSSASRVLKLNRSYFRSEVYINTVEDAKSRLESAEGTLLQFTSQVGATLGDETLAALNGASPETRETYATSLRELQQTLLQFSNSTYQDKYVFAGADGENAAFTTDDAGNIFYRDINVTTGLRKDGTDGSAELAALANEKLYVDVGLGMQSSAGGDSVANNSEDFNGASAFDMSMPGIACFGYGSVDDTGISKNIMALLGQMADELEKPEFNNDRFQQMRDQLKDSHDQLADFDASVGIKDKFLDNTKEKLETDKLSIYKEIDSLANIKPETAIMDYSYAEYAYNMVLKVGSSLLTSSLLDYVK